MDLDIVWRPLKVVSNHIFFFCYQGLYPGEVLCHWANPIAINLLTGGFQLPDAFQWHLCTLAVSQCWYSKSPDCNFTDLLLIAMVLRYLGLLQPSLPSLELRQHAVARAQDKASQWVWGHLPNWTIPWLHFSTKSLWTIIFIKMYVSSNLNSMKAANHVMKTRVCRCTVEVQPLKVNRKLIF